MIYFLHGPDTLNSRAKLNEIIEEYRRRSGGDLNFHKIDAEDSPAGFSLIREIVDTESLFNPKKLVVVQNGFSYSEYFSEIKAIAERFQNSKDTTLIFWERKLDEKAEANFSEIKRFFKKIQEFKTKEVEIPKRSASAKTSIFELGDVFFTSKQIALKKLLFLLSQGFDEFNIFSYLANHARNLLIVKSYLDARQPVSPHHQIHPFVIKKVAVLAREISQERLKLYLRRFFEADVMIKTGVLKPGEAIINILTD